MGGGEGRRIRSLSWSGRNSRFWGGGRVGGWKNAMNMRRLKFDTETEGKRPLFIAVEEGANR